MSQWLLTPNVDVTPIPFEIRFWVNGSWFKPLHDDEEDYTAEILLIAAVDDRIVPPNSRHRKIKVHASVRPTQEFSKRFFTSNEDAKVVSHETDYFLDSNVQLDIWPER